jgi:hypothetical protein
MKPLMNNVKEISSPKCKGSVFRANVQHFRTSQGFGFTVRLNKMKKLSCPGCDKCAWQHDYFAEVCNDWSIRGIESAEDKKLYTIETCNESRDYETGYIDSWDFKLVEY